MLVIRSITPGDIVFMRGHDRRYVKDYLQPYLRAFAKGIPATFIQEVIDALVTDNRKE